jgi:hypothetical protein
MRIPKLKLTIPQDPYWPSEYHGRVIEVDIASVQLPSGNVWHCMGFEVAAASFDEPGKDTTTLQHEFNAKVSLVELIGGSPKNITIGF